MLLHKKGPKNFEHLRTINGEVYPTFTKAAQKLGILQSDDAFKRAMDDFCVEISNSNKLQRFFAMLIVHGKPSDPQKMFDDYLDQMFPALPSNEDTTELRRGKVMCNLEYFFNQMGTSSRLAFKLIF